MFVLIICYFIIVTGLKSYSIVSLHADIYLFLVFLLAADKFVKSLAQVVPVYKGEDGQSGASKNCYGRNGNPTYICVSP